MSVHTIMLKKFALALALALLWAPATEQAAEAVVKASASDKSPAVTRPQVSQQACPAINLSIAGLDGNTVTAVMRKPGGKGPFPAILYLHGGLSSRTLDGLRKTELDGPTLPRFLAAGFVTVSATFRSREREPLTKEALRDCLAVIAYLKALPEVDPESVVVYGTSGGGSLALELAGEASLAAVIAEEPATVLFTGVMKTPDFSVVRDAMEHPEKYDTPELAKYTQPKIDRITCPIFIAWGNIHKINHFNHVVFIPKLKAAGKKPVVTLYDHEEHGFSIGHGSPQAALKFFNDAMAFLGPILECQPRALDSKLVDQVPAASHGKDMSDPGARVPRRLQTVIDKKARGEELTERERKFLERYGSKKKQQ